MRLDIDRKLLSSLLIMGAMVEARDAYTGGHLWRVAQFSRLLAERCGFDRTGVALAAVGGFLHDLGKVAIPDAILNKPDRLTEAEYAIIKTHPGIGREVLAQHPLAPLALDAVTYHHERPDGGGYPERLVGEQIPEVARMVAIADAFDAMTSTRSYRKGMPVAQALAILEGERGNQFDSRLSGHFLDLGRTGRLNEIVGHSLAGHRLADCPMCGPVVAVHHLADGARHACRACGGEFRLHKRGDETILEATGQMADAELMAPRPDAGPIPELVEAFF